MARALARNTDPSTSWTAAEAVEASGTAQYQREQALAAVKANPFLTSHELAERTGLNRYMLARRLPELTELEQGDKREKRICKVSGKKCVVWQLRKAVLQ